jgi:hypothetical protein
MLDCDWSSDVCSSDLTVSARAGAAGDVIGQVVIEARGAHSVRRAMDLNGNGSSDDTLVEMRVGLDANHDGLYTGTFTERGLAVDFNGNGVTTDLVSEAALGRDLNGDGDQLDTIHESSVDFNGNGRYDDVVSEALLGRDLDGDGLATHLVSEAGFGVDLNGDGDGMDRYNEALLGVDYNGDGDILDTVAENQGLAATGFINVQLAALPAARFELRALRDIDVAVTGDLNLSGFVGGLSGYGPAANVTLLVGGTLSVRGGIVNANAAAGGDILVQADQVDADGASVFIADRLQVTATRAVTLNTLVATLAVDSTGSGDITVRESDALVIERVHARNGAIQIKAGGAVDAREVVGDADAAGKDVIVRAAGDLRVDRIEAGADAGARKQYANVLVESQGSVSELAAYVLDGRGSPSRGADGAFITAYDQSSADLYGHTVTVIGSVVPPAVVLRAATDAGTTNEIEVRVTSDAADAYTVTREGGELSNASAQQAGGASVQVGTTLVTADRKSVV